MSIVSTKFNPRGPDVKEIINRHLNILESNTEINKLLPRNTILVANKREENLKELLVRGDPYSIKEQLMEVGGYKKCEKKCDSCDSFVAAVDSIISTASGRKYTIRANTTCASKNVIYVAFCTKCNMQGVGSTVSWKARLSNYKSHIKKKIRSCCIVNHFIDDCSDAQNPVKYLRFIIVDTINNTVDLDKNNIEQLLLKKEKFWIGTLITQHKGLNGTHDWNRKKRTDKRIIT